MNREALINEGLPFLESIPDEWQLIPNKWLFKYDGEKVGDKWKDYSLLSLTTQGIKLKDLSIMGGKVPESYDNYQTVRAGQMVFCLFDLDVSAVFSGISELDGMITSAYDVFSSTDLITNDYADYWFKYVFSNRYYKLYSKNIRFTVTSDNFGMIKTPLPPVEIQRKIAKILKSKESKINALIANEEKQIEKLKAYKQSLISEVVTKGLDPNAPMKDSGIQWVGKIPDEWKVGRIKAYTRSIRDKWNLGNFPYVALENIESFTGNYLYTDTNRNYALNDTIVAKRNDVLFGKLRPYLGKSFVLREDSCVSSEFAVFRCDTAKIQPLFLHYLFLNPNFVAYINGTAYGTKMPRANIETISGISIPLPNIDIQKKIINVIDKLNFEISSTIRIKQRKIDSLRTYLRSVIYEYVTGKREAK